MSTWYYYNEQGEKIETTGGRLKGLAKAGMITPETIVENEEGKKAPARKVKGLTFATAATPESAPPVETESYGIAQPVPVHKPPIEANPFAVAALEEVNPFATAAPPAAKPIEKNPFAVSTPTAKQEVPRQVATPVAGEYEDFTESPAHRFKPIHVFAGIGVLLLVLVLVGVGISFLGGGRTNSIAVEKLEDSLRVNLMFTNAMSNDNLEGMFAAWSMFEDVDVASFSPAYRAAHREHSEKMMQTTAAREVLLQTIRRGEDVRVVRELYHQQVQSFLDSGGRFLEIVEREHASLTRGSPVGNVAGTQSIAGQTPPLPNATASPTVIELSGHTSWVTSAAFSPNGEKIVTASHLYDETARIWDTNSGKELQRLEEEGSVIDSATFSPDGRKVATISNVLRIWDADSGRELQTLRGDWGNSRSVDFSLDGKIVVAGSNLTAQIFDVDSGRRLHELRGHTGDKWSTTTRVNSASFSPDGRRVVTTGTDRTARIWDTNSGKELQRLEGHSFCLATFSPDGRKIITVDDAGAARTWDANSGRALLLIKHTDSSYYYTASFSPDGSKIVTAGRNVTETTAEGYVRSSEGIIQIWDSNSGSELHRLEGLKGTVHSVAFSPDGRRIVAGSDDKIARIWNLQQLPSVMDVNKVAEVQSNAEQTRPQSNATVPSAIQTRTDDVVTVGRTSALR